MLIRNYSVLLCEPAVLGTLYDGSPELSSEGRGCVEEGGGWVGGGGGM